MRIGMMSTTFFAGTLDQVIDDARQAEARGLDSYWVPQIFGYDTLTVLALVGREVPRIELGTAVVPTFPRHPMMLAQQALTVQAAIGGRLALGIGLCHQVVVEQMWGLSFDKPVRHLREYLSVLVPMLDGQNVSFDGETYAVHAAASVMGGTRPPVLVAALGPQMLKVCGAMTEGTSTWCVGQKTLESFTIPTVRQAAADAGRPEPRIVCALPIAVTSDVDGARKRAADLFAIYNTLPSYRSMMDREGVEGPGELAIVGSEDEVRDQLRELEAIGVTDFNASMFPGDPDEAEATNAVLGSWGS
jgi:F420-dependent oxidoreductase-like protein